MSFIGNLVEEFTHQKRGEDEYPQQQYGGQSQGYNRPPQCPPPWIAEWDGAAERWIYINRETGHRSFEFPGEYRGEYRGEGYGGYPQQQGGYYEQPPPQQQNSHTGRNIALAAGAGLLGGALLMHEGEKVEEKWDEDKYRLEEDVDRTEGYVDRKFDDGVQDVEDFPEDAARWTGRKVQEVEDIPQDIENKWDNGVQDVEDIPEDVAGWAGRKVGDVERFDDNVDNAYDEGRYEARYDNY